MNAQSLSPEADTPALHNALTRLHAVRPVWSGVLAAREAVGLAPMTLLHAGPPFSNPRQPSAPVLSSAVVCCLYEGWADTETQAELLIAEGRVTLLPAQSYRIVTPLAAVISPSSSLVEVVDGGQANGSRCWSLLGSGAGAQLRFGTRNPAILARMAWRDQHLAPALQAVLNTAPIELIPLAVAGLRGGDDLHSRTTSATTALLQRLSSAVDADVTAMLESTPLFFLTLWMASCYLMLDATRSADPIQSTKLLLALAGNGIDAGVRLADNPDAWITTPGHVPQGPRLGADLIEASPMLGDSGVIDAAGFGAQAWFYATETAEAMAGWLPGGTGERPAWLVGNAPEFGAFGLGSAIDVSRISDAEPTPRMAIAMLDARGEQGLLGRGVCLTDPTLFGAARTGMAINDAATLASLNHAFERYERALTGNDVAVLDELFWDSPHTVRYGTSEHLYGYEAIQAFRHARPGKGLDRRILQRSVSSFGQDFAVTNMVFSREGQAQLGRQTQSWVRIDGQWRIVAAHVSGMSL